MSLIFVWFILVLIKKYVYVSMFGSGCLTIL